MEILPALRKTVLHRRLERKGKMIYLLNFKDHTFKTCSSAKEAISSAEDLFADGVKFDEVEFVACFDSDDRFDYDTFCNAFSENGGVR